jgi:hypothetical protein
MAVACGAGAGVGAGFCGGFCANTGEAEPTLRAPAKNAASKDRVDGQRDRLMLQDTGKMDSLAVAEKVAMMIFTPRDFCPNGTIFVFTQLSKTLKRWNLFQILAGFETPRMQPWLL